MVEILQEGMSQLPRCDQCGMYMQAASFFKNRQMDKCNKTKYFRIRWIYADMAARCGKMEVCKGRRGKIWWK